MVWKKEWGGDIIFSHGSNRSRGVCILIDPSENIKSEHSFNDSNGQIGLTTIEFNGFKLSLCNICAPNNLKEQITFMQELNGFLIDKSEITSLIVGGDWNFSKERQKRRVQMETHELQKWDLNDD